jgi:hypothetical protein
MAAAPQGGGRTARPMGDLGHPPWRLEEIAWDERQVRRGVAHALAPSIFGASVAAQCRVLRARAR